MNTSGLVLGSVAVLAETRGSMLQGLAGLCRSAVVCLFFGSWLFQAFSGGCPPLCINHTLYTPVPVSSHLCGRPAPGH
jgi:hypothetical protein